MLGCFEGLVCGVVFAGFGFRFGFGICLGLVGFGLVNCIIILQTKTSNYDKIYQSKLFKVRHETNETSSLRKLGRFLTSFVVGPRPHLCVHSSTFRSSHLFRSHLQTTDFARKPLRFHKLHSPLVLGPTNPCHDLSP